MIKSKTEQADTPVESQRFNVIINGEDRIIMAKDKADLDQKIAKIRSELSPHST